MSVHNHDPGPCDTCMDDDEQSPTSWAFDLEDQRDVGGMICAPINDAFSMIAMLPLHPIDSNEYWPEQWVNGHLMAAAPDLLEAAKSSFEAIDYVLTRAQLTGQRLDDAIGKAKEARNQLTAAIAKAEGKP